MVLTCATGKAAGIGSVKALMVLGYPMFVVTACVVALVVSVVFKAVRG